MPEINLNPDPRGLLASMFQGSKEAAGKRVKKDRPTFRSTLEKVRDGVALTETPALATGPELDGAIEALLDSVHSEGDVLKDSPTFDNIRRYKDAVKRFMAFVVRNSYDTKEAVSGFSILNRKKHTLVVMIDQKLEQLAAGLLQGQKDQMEILRRLEEISGLLVDLLQ